MSLFSNIRLGCLLVCWTLTLFFSQGVAAEVSAREDPVAREILAKSDEIRFPAEGFQVDILITSSTPDAEPELRKYRVLSKGNENTVVMILEPASERGQIMLMKSRDLWVFMPNVSQPIRLGLAQRLTGQVANGDLARANFSGDYSPRIVRTELLEGQEHIVLELNAKDRGVTYHRVLLWVNSSNHHPHKAEFFSLSNRLLKTCRYQDFKQLAGRTRPTRLVMEDALKPGHESILHYAEMRLRNLPDKVFTKDYLKKLQ
jgi:hypothetical protein